LIALRLTSAQCWTSALARSGGLGNQKDFSVPLSGATSGFLGGLLLLERVQQSSGFGRGGGTRPGKSIFTEIERKTTSYKQDKDGNITITHGDKDSVIERIKRGEIPFGLPNTLEMDLNQELDQIKIEKKKVEQQFAKGIITEAVAIGIIASLDNFQLDKERALRAIGKKPTEPAPFPKFGTDPKATGFEEAQRISLLRNQMKAKAPFLKLGQRVFGNQNYLNRPLNLQERSAISEFTQLGGGKGFDIGPKVFANASDLRKFISLQQNTALASSSAQVGQFLAGAGGLTAAGRGLVAGGAIISQIDNFTRSTCC